MAQMVTGRATAPNPAPETGTAIDRPSSGPALPADIGMGVSARTAVSLPDLVGMAREMPGPEGAGRLRDSLTQSGQVDPAMTLAAFKLLNQ